MLSCVCVKLFHRSKCPVCNLKIVALFVMAQIDSIILTIKRGKRYKSLLKTLNVWYMYSVMLKPGPEYLGLPLCKHPGMFSDGSICHLLQEIPLSLLTIFYEISAGLSCLSKYVKWFLSRFSYKKPGSPQWIKTLAVGTIQVFLPPFLSFLSLSSPSLVSTSLSFPPWQRACYLCVFLSTLTILAVI